MDFLLLHSIESFPPLKQSITDLNRLFSEPEIDIKAIAKTIESDPMLYTAILHYANAPGLGLKTAINSVNQAITLFGVQRIRGMTLSAAFKAHPFTDFSPYNISQDQWLDVMHRQERFLSLWIIQTNRSLFQTLGATIYILEIGRLIVSYQLMETHNPYRFVKTYPPELAMEEKNIIGEAGDELAAYLFKNWNFDPVMIDFLQHSLNPSLSQNPKIAAMLYCARILFPCRGEGDFDKIEPVISEYGFDREWLISTFKTIQGASNGNADAV